MLLNYKNELISIEVQRTDRTTFCLSIREDGSVLARAPLHLPDHKIMEMVKEKAEWLYTHRKEIKQRQSKMITRDYSVPGTLMYFGREVPVEVINSKDSEVVLTYHTNEAGVEEEKILIYTTKGDTESIQKLLKKWYKKQTIEYLGPRLYELAKEMNLTYGIVSIKSRKKQWGTCDTNGDLTFSWRLSMAQKSSSDYVIVHELCHRKFMDHSKQFWKAVEQVLPDYKAREQWLNDNSVNMTI